MHVFHFDILFSFEPYDVLNYEMYAIVNEFLQYIMDKLVLFENLNLM